MKKVSWLEKNASVLMLLSINIICFTLLMKIDDSIIKQTEEIKELGEIFDSLPQPPPQPKCSMLRPRRSI